jgi:hypothetical protein
MNPVFQLNRQIKTMNKPNINKKPWAHSVNQNALQAIRGSGLAVCAKSDSAAAKSPCDTGV